MNTVHISTTALIAGVRLNIVHGKTSRVAIHTNELHAH